jgi:hypothetical protein
MGSEVVGSSGSRMEITSGDMDVHPYVCIDAITTQQFSILTKDLIGKFDDSAQNGTLLGLKEERKSLNRDVTERNRINLDPII